MDDRKLIQVRSGVSAVLLISAVSLSVVGCTKPPPVSSWQKNDVTQEQKAGDISDCRRFARRETEREAGLPPTASSADPLSGAQSYNRMTTNYDLGRFQDEMFARCMRKLGYEPLSKKKS